MIIIHSCENNCIIQFTHNSLIQIKGAFFLINFSP
nr:MAG TPA: hypothetical protein [Caudoviricetes sp.]